LNAQANCPDAADEGALFPWLDQIYDMLFLAAYAHLADGNCNLPTSQLTGQHFANGLTALAPDGQVDPANAFDKKFLATDIVSTTAALCQGGEVNVLGASSELDFDLSYHSPKSDVGIYCVTPGAMFPSTATWSLAQTYISATGTAGPFMCPTQ